MYSILLSLPFACSFIVLFCCFPLWARFISHPCAFSWFFFPTENDAYKPAYSSFFPLYFLVLLNCHQPTCIYSHFSSTKICKSAANILEEREEKNPKHDIYQTEDWTKIQSCVVCGKYNIWKKIRGFCLCSYAFGCWEKVSWCKPYQVTPAAFGLGPFISTCLCVWCISVFSDLAAWRLKHIL